MIVHQILAGAGPHDAVTAQARAFRARFAQWGWAGADHAVFIAPGLNGAVIPLARFAPADSDTLVIHHSAVTPRLHELLALPNPKLLVYHNVTPPQWLWDVSPVLAVQCAIGREQLAEIVHTVEVAAAVSAYNAAELTEAGARSATVIPPLIDLDRLGPTAPAQRDPNSILFVGRLSPHKRQDEVIRAFALYREHRAPDAHLTLVGDAIAPAYEQRIHALADALAPGAVAIERGLTDAELGDRYRVAAAFLCLSEHEGFCLPLIEALRFGVPVIARRFGAVPETLGDAGLLLEPVDDLAVVAELLHIAVTDCSLRDELARRAGPRIAAYDPERAAAALRAAIEATTT